MRIRHLAGLAAVATARAAVAFVLGLAACGAVPALFGWEPTSVMSASMAPAIRTGDVVVARPVARGELRPGRVLLADDPDRPDRLRLHRLESIAHDGLLRTRGDANPTADSSLLHADDVHGVGVLRVPWIGWPAVWARTNDLAPLVGTVVALVLSLTIALRRGRDDDPEPEPDEPRPAPTTRRARRALGLSLVVATLAGATTAPAWAAFSATSSASGSVAAGHASPPTRLGCVDRGGAIVTWRHSGLPARGFDLLVDGRVVRTGIPGDARAARVPLDRYYSVFDRSVVTVRARVSQNWTATSSEGAVVGGVLFGFGTPFCL